MIRFEWRLLQQFLSWKALGLFLAPLVIYSSVYTGRYLHHDDWHHSFVKPMHCADAPMAWTFNTLGRPLAGNLVCLTFSKIQSFESAQWARGVYVLLTGLFGLLLFLFLRRASVKTGPALFLAFAILCLPAIGIFNYWLGASFVVVSLVFTALAAYLTLIEQTFYGVAQRRLRIGIVVLLTASLLIYQIGMTYYAVFFYMAFLANIHRPHFVRSLTTRFGIFFVTSCALYATWYFGSGLASRLAHSDPTRGQFVKSPLELISWLFTVAFDRAGRLWFPFSAGSLGVFLALGVGACVLYWRRGGRRELALLWVVSAGAFLATYAPVLASSFRVPAFRTLIGISSLITAMVILAPITVNSMTLKRALSVIAILVAGLMGAQAYYFTRYVLVEPEVRELNLVSTDSQASFATNKVRIFVGNDSNLQLDTDEIFAPSTSFAQNPEKILNRIRLWNHLEPVEVDVVKILGQPFDLDWSGVRKQVQAGVHLGGLW